MLSLIVAMDKNRVIGNHNQLPWHLPADLKHFKQITMGKPIIMGRKTFESIGKPLPGRQNIVISRQWTPTEQAFTVVSSLPEAIAQASQAEEVFIIGGQQLFEQALALTQRVYLTKIHHAFDGDTYFPVLNEKEWRIVSEENHKADEQNAYAYSFLILERTLNR